MNTDRLLRHLRKPTLSAWPSNIRNTPIVLPLQPIYRQLLNSYRSPYSGYILHIQNEYGRWQQVKDLIEPNEATKPQPMKYLAPTQAVSLVNNELILFDSIHKVGLFAQYNHHNAPLLHNEPPHYGHAMPTNQAVSPRLEQGPELNQEQPGTLNAQPQPNMQI